MLTDKEIKQLIKFKRLRIEPFDPKRLGPVSYDLTTFRKGEYRGVLRLVSEERITLARNIAGWVSLRSNTTKRNIFASFSSLVDPGYSGHLIFLVFDPTNRFVGNLINIFQIVFFKVGEVEVAYDEREKSTAMDRKDFS